MPWVLVDILIAVLALLVLGGALLIGYLHVKQLMRTAKESSSKVGVVTAQIDALQSASAARRTP